MTKKQLKETLKRMSQNIEIWKISDLKPYEKNSRTHSETQLDEIARSVERFGFTNPLLIMADGTIIAGHGRVEAVSTRLGWEEVPVIVLDYLSKDDARMLVITDNKLSDNAGWDEETLAQEMLYFREKGLDLEITGFDQLEIDSLLSQFDEIEEEEQEDAEVSSDEEVTIPEIPVSALGDVWILGNHRLFCGDSTKKESFEKLLGGQKASMVFTDPPYNMDFDGGIHADGSKSHNAKHGKIKNDKMTPAQAEEFFNSVNKRISENLNGPFYITFYRFGIEHYWRSLEKNKMPVKALIIWNKGNHTLSNSDYMSMYEPIFYGWVGDHKFYGGKNGRDIWDVSRTSINDLHPTMKPVPLVEKALDDGSVVRDVVLDPFGGSGSTIIACENLKRHARVIELDPIYCDVIVKRWQVHTGKKATLESTNKTFADMMKERLNDEEKEE